MGLFSKMEENLFAQSLSGQISDRGVQWILEHAWDPQVKELMFFFEPDAPRPIEAEWSIDVAGVFYHHPEVGIAQGMGKGHAFFRTSYLRKVIELEGKNIQDYVSLVKAFFKHGYQVNQLGYIHCEPSSF
jgi:hypothetical protein